MKSDEIIKRLRIEPYSVVLATAVGWKPIDYYPKSDLDRIVAELSAEINRLNIENQTMYDTEGKQFALMKEGYEADIKVLRDALEGTRCWFSQETMIGKGMLKRVDEALSQSSPLSALEEVRKAAKIQDRFTGKSLDNPSDNLPKQTKEKCDSCGTFLIDRCLHCGAPVCCPKCCEDARKG